MSAVGHFCPVPYKFPEVFAKPIWPSFGFQSGELSSKKRNVIFAFFRGRG